MYPCLWHFFAKNTTGKTRRVGGNLELEGVTIREAQDRRGSAQGRSEPLVELEEQDVWVNRDRQLRRHCKYEKEP